LIRAARRQRSNSPDREENAMDIWSSEKRSFVMGRIRGRDTKPELVVRSLLHRAGFRYSLARKDLPGKPDIVMPKYKTVIFVHGCFWHRHEGCPVSTNPKSRTLFWQDKFSGNVARDLRNQTMLSNLGWKVVVLWECEVLRDPHALLGRLLKELGVKRSLTYDDLPERRVLLKAAEERLQWNLSRSGKRT
jgi:DNA mismatch endonuclease (patch repair protein)